MAAPDRSQSDSSAETHAACCSSTQLLLKLLACETVIRTITWERLENLVKWLLPQVPNTFTV